MIPDWMYYESRLDTLAMFCNLEHRCWEIYAMSDFETPTYVNDGMDVWIRWSRTDRTLLRCKVICAAGNHARVENKHHKIDNWFRIDDLLVPTDAIVEKIMES